MPVPLTDPAVTDRMIDQLDIMRTLSTLAQAQDDLDREAYLSCFTETVLLTQAAVFDDWEPTELPASELADKYFAELEKYDSGQHLVANHLINVDGDEATCRADLYATAVRTEGGHTRNAFVGGRYNLKLRRVDGRWLIFERGVKTRLQGEYPAGEARS